MAISLSETQALAELGEHLYDYLPGSSAWQGTYTFANAAADAGVPNYWQGGSKLPALTKLLELTLDQQRGSFCRLIETIVRRGIQYRTRKQNPLTRQDVEELNSLVLRVGFKIPDLWNQGFLASLPDAPKTETAREATAAEDAVTTDGETENRRRSLDDLRTRFLGLQTQPDRQAAGLALEKLLNELFALFDLQPSSAFRVVGEQIDGAFLLDSEVYLLEAKWTRDQTPEADLLAFRGKVEGKSSITRGLFISINGFSSQAVPAITRGKQPTFVMMDGADLYRILEGHIHLDELLRRKVRYLAERGEPYVPVSDLCGDLDELRTTGNE